MKKAARKKKETLVEKADNEVLEAIVPDVVEQKRMKKLVGNKPVFIGTIIVILLVIGAGGFYAFLYFQKDAKPSNAQLSSEQIKELVDDVGKLIVLPEEETPTIATVTDVEKLTDQPFFRTAQNGDKVLLFGGTKEAILYRPSINKIIRMSPINATDIATPSPSLAPQSDNVTPGVNAASSKIKIAVLNSTKEAGLARKGAALFDKEKYEIVSTSNAYGEYPSTTVTSINTTAATDTVVRTLVTTLKNVKAVPKALPPNEVPPSGVDAVIILGNDFADAY